MAERKLSEAGREQVAIALILLKDWKSDGKVDIEVMKMVLDLADALGVKEEFDRIHMKIPAMKIEPR